MLLTSVAVTMASIAFSGDAPVDGSNKISFLDIAPKNSMLLVSMHDMRGMVKRFESTPLSNLCEIDAVKELISGTVGSALTEMRDRLEDEGQDADAIIQPTALGFSVYVDLDEETGQSRSYIFGYGDWGDNADKAQQTFEFIFEKGREEGAIEIDTRDVRGRDVKVIESIGEEEDFGDAFGGMDQMMMLGDPSILFPDTDTMYMVREDSKFILANDLLAIDDALAVFDGDDIESAGDVEDVQRINGMLGDGDAVFMMRFEPLGELMAPMMMGPLGMADMMIDELFGGIRGFGMSMAMGGDVGMLTLSGAVYSPDGKEGLLALVDESTPIDNSPPKMVPIDAISYSRINVNFKDMIPLVRNLASAMPMGGQEIDNALDMYEPTVKPALDTLGPEIYMYGTVRKPIEMDSSSTVMMVEAEDPDRVHPMMALMGPSMGMEPRDFKGETIWSDPMGAMSMAVAGKWMFMGESRGVEQAIRAMEGGADSITDNPIFTSSTRRLDSDKAVGWGWADMVEQYAVQRQMLKNMNEMMGGFDEFAPDGQAGGDQFEETMSLLQEVTPEDLSRCMGPMIWTLTSPKDGLIQRMWLLPPTKQAG